MSRTFSAKHGSVEILKLFTTCGLTPKVRQMRPTLSRPMPAALAMVRRLQWLRFAGGDSRVLVRTSSTFASLMVRGLPERGASQSTPMPSFAKRLRHLRTVCESQRQCWATSRLLGLPSAQARMMEARKALRWEVLGREASSWSFSRSSAVGQIRTMLVDIPKAIVPVIHQIQRFVVNFAVKTLV